MTTDLSALADAVSEAVRRHAAAVLDSTEDRAAAGPALTEALEAYGVAVINAGSELPEGLEDFDGFLDEEDGIEHPEEEPDTGERVAVFVRADFVVDDLAVLRAAATEAMQSCCPAAAGEDPADAVRDPDQAVTQLLGHHWSVFDPEQMERHGLRLVAETVDAVAVPADSDMVEDYPWGPLLDLQDEQDEQDG